MARSPRYDAFLNRHLGPDNQQTDQMLELLDIETLEDLIDEIVPRAIRRTRAMNLPTALTEQEYLQEAKRFASMNRIRRSFIGMGYYDTWTPPVLLRNVLENPGWYTAYTPYQAEISQGRLEALLNFQTMICDLSGMEIANASLLDEATAAAEAMSMLHSLRKRTKRDSDRFFVSSRCHPQVISVIRGRAHPVGIDVVVGNEEDLTLDDESLFALLLSTPASDGELLDHSELIARAHEKDLTVAVTSDLLALTLLKSPGEMGADVVVGSAQRFGVPMGYGGPHAGWFATRETFKRQIPGRIIGVSRDREGNPAFRMALQTREQHIRREKATSNICTSQVLLAVMAGFYAVWHGPDGLKNIAERVHMLAARASEQLRKSGYTVRHNRFFDTLAIDLNPEDHVPVQQRAQRAGINLRFDDNGIGISFDETKSESDLIELLQVFDPSLREEVVERSTSPDYFPESMRRTDSILTHPIFRSVRSEHQMLRYLKQLENRDLSLTHSMISLGSCTMKLNATAEMIPMTWPEFGRLHPFAPRDQAEGTLALIRELEEWLGEITGLPAVSLQPNSGAQGELTGLLMIRAWHRDQGHPERTICLVPSSAHGTNPASATLAGMDVVVVSCDEKGNIDLEDLNAKLESHPGRIGALMVTYPSTHGVFEESIQTVCSIVHEAGGLVYLDGANMNAQVGITSPAEIGADVCHLNLHKTFCIPHGGGGPGVGPVAAGDHLRPYLPGHPLAPFGTDQAIDPVSAAPYGSASILGISHAYIRMLGAEGLTMATKIAILNANYLKERLASHYPILYTGAKGRTAHEFILDLRPLKQSAGVDVTDVAKRLMDYGFHAPTMSFPVPGTLMIEPTESESIEELDRFCDAMISIRNEIRDIENGVESREVHLLNQAPHTSRVLLSDDWDRPYSRETAAFPLPDLKFHKFWPAVSRVDDAWGDRNLYCACVPVSAYAEGQSPHALPLEEE
ncbi:MAG: aminomethyl-transferring glycine dehydrogenase [Balneolaceae bacterium]